MNVFSIKNIIFCSAVGTLGGLAIANNLAESNFDFIVGILLSVICMLWTFETNKDCSNNEPNKLKEIKNGKPDEKTK